MRVSDPVEGDGPTEKSVGITSSAFPSWPRLRAERGFQNLSQRLMGKDFVHRWLRNLAAFTVRADPFCPLTLSLTLSFVFATFCLI